jgi:hypothetical protein
MAACAAAGGLHYDDQYVDRAVLHTVLDEVSDRVVREPKAGTKVQERIRNARAVDDADLANQGPTGVHIPKDDVNTRTGRPWGNRLRKDRPDLHAASSTASCPPTPP